MFLIDAPSESGFQHGVKPIHKLMREVEVIQLTQNLFHTPLLQWLVDGTGI